MSHALLIFLFSFHAFALSPQEMEADILKNPDHLSTRIQLANIYLKQNQFDHVIQLLNSYTDQLPSQGYLALASSYSNKKDYFNEVRVLNLLTTKEDQDFHWRMLLRHVDLSYTWKQKSKSQQHIHASYGITSRGSIAGRTGLALVFSTGTIPC